MSLSILTDQWNIFSQIYKETSTFNLVCNFYVFLFNCMGKFIMIGNNTKLNIIKILLRKLEFWKYACFSLTNYVGISLNSLKTFILKLQKKILIFKVSYGKCFELLVWRIFSKIVTTLHGAIYSLEYEQD